MSSSTSPTAMTRTQIAETPRVPEPTRLTQGWGLGWRLNPGHDAHAWGDLLGPRAFGHAGATGTVVWYDPDRALACALFTNEPLDHCARFLGRCSNALAACAMD